MSGDIRRAFTTKYTGKGLQLINRIVIHPPRQFSEIQFDKIDVNAIWDTGATHSCISSRLAKQLKLIPNSKRTTNTAGGLKTSDVYTIDIQLPNRVIMPSVMVAEIDLIDSVDALIGMDIIGEGDFAVNSYDGKTSFSFRLPSCHTVDYANIENKRNEKNLSSTEKQKKKAKRKQANNSRKKNRKK